MNPIQLFDPASSTYTYVLFDAASRLALIIDPVDEQIERDLACLNDHGLRLVWAVETHAHADHITSAGRLAELAGARLAAPAGCGIGTAATQLQQGDTLAFGHESMRALHTQAFRRVVWPQLARRLRWPLLAVLAYGLTVVDMAIVIGPASPPTLAMQAWQWLLDTDPLLQARGAAAGLLLVGLLAVCAVALAGLALLWLVLQQKKTAKP